MGGEGAEGAARGSEASPGVGQAAGEVQGTGGEDPPGHHVPGKHWKDPPADTPPGAHVYPGAEAQGVHSEAELSPVDAP